MKNYIDIFLFLLAIFTVIYSCFAFADILRMKKEIIEKRLEIEKIKFWNNKLEKANEIKTRESKTLS